MWSLVLLLLVGAAWAQGQPCAGDRERPVGMGMASARVDSHQIRLNTLEDQIAKLGERANDAAGSNVGQAARNLAARLDKLEGSGCRSGQFQCGGDRKQCVSNLLVCDGSVDCGNGADESEANCKVRVPAGSTWEGDVFWSSCKTFKDQTMRLIITGNRRVNYFQSRVWINAVATFENEEGGATKTRTFNSQGNYSFGQKRAVLFPPAGAEMQVGIVCDFVTDDAADCTLTQLVSLETCAKVRLSKK